MTTAKPITSSRPTNRELADSINAAHDCIHNVGEKVDSLETIVRENRDASTNGITQVREQVARIEGALGIRMPSDQQMADGARPEHAGRRFGGLKQWQAFATIFSAGLGSLTLYKLLEPVVVTAAVGLHHALMRLGGPG